MKTLYRITRPILISFILFTVICGLAYPLIITTISNGVFPIQSTGSIITIKSNTEQPLVVGSALIGQTFTQSKYLIGRPSDDTNLSPVSAEYQKVVEARILWWHTLDPINTAKIPSDLVQASASGVDPYISVAAAEYQVSRIARARTMSEDAVRSIIKTHTIDRFLGVWGEPVVNVLEVNLALDGLKV